jgi:hypothetical protein
VNVVLKVLLIICRSGRVARRYMGCIDYKELSSDIETILKR